MTQALNDTAAPEAPPPSRNAFAYPAFVKVWRGQTISVFGSQMTAFALSIWIFQQTGSVLQFGAILAAQMVPSILFSPLAGALIDRVHRKVVMLACDVGLIAITLLLCVLTHQGQLTPTTILVMSPLLALFGSTHQIAYASSIALLVPRPAYAKANGYIQLGINGSAAIVPLISVHALESLGLMMMFVLSIGTYSVAALSLLFTTFMERPASATAKAKAGKAPLGTTLANLVAQQTFGMRYLLSHRSLLLLVLFLGGVSFLNGIVMVLFRPMILGSSSAAVLGWLAMIGGVGGLAGAITAAMAANADKVRTLLVASLVSGSSMALCGSSTNFAVMAVTAFTFSFAAPFIMVAAQTLLQTITPVDTHGRVFAARAFFSGVALISAVGAAPLLTEYVFVPLMRDGALLEGWGHWLAAGASAGMRAVFMLAGAGMVLLSLMFVRGRHFQLLSEQARSQKPLAVPAVSQ